MSNDTKVIRLEPSGPPSADMTEWQLDAADFQSDLPLQHGHTYFEDPALGLTVGVWDTTTMQEAFGPYPGDEFMWILEGQACMMDGDENGTIIKQGQTFCIRNAIPISWKQVGFLRKIYMTYSNPDSPTPEISSADGGVRILDPVELENGMTRLDTTDPLEIKKNLPVQRENIVFTNDAGNMFTGMWDSTAFESEMRPFRFHEMVQLLEGEVTITDEDGTASSFSAGDAFFIPMGTVCSWKATGYIRKFYSILDPGAQSTTQ